MASNDWLQYMLLGLASGAKSYTERRNELADMDRRWGTVEERKRKQQLDSDLLLAQTDSARALTRQRDAQADWYSRRESGTRSSSKAQEKDAFEEAIKGIYPSSLRPSVELEVRKLAGDKWDYESAIPAAERALDDVPNQFKVTEKPPTLDEEIDTGWTQDYYDRQLKNRNEARQARAATLSVLNRLKALGYAQAARPGAGMGGMAGPTPPPGPVASGGPQLMDSMTGQPFQAGPPGPAASGPEVPGAKRFTEPRMPSTPEVATANFNAFFGADGGPGATLDDRRRAGELAELFTYLYDTTLPFHVQAMAWFKANTLAGIPVPQVFQTWAQAQGIPRHIVDQGRGEMQMYKGRIGQAMHKRKRMLEQGIDPEERRQTPTDSIDPEASRANYSIDPEEPRGGPDLIDTLTGRPYRERRK